MTERRTLNPVDVEFAILDLCDALERETEQYASLSEIAAGSEADYKFKFAQTHVQLAAASSMKMTVHERQARADLAANDEFRVFKINEARKQASKEAMLSIRARLDAMRTLSASLRNQT